MFPSDGALVCVVGIDFSSVSPHLLAATRDLVLRFRQVELHVVHVMRVRGLPGPLIDALPQSTRSVSPEIEAAHERLDELCEHLVVGLPTAVTTHVRAGRPELELPRVAEEVGAHLLVVEHHDGRRVATPARRFWRRSLSEVLTRTAPCSVLSVRSEPTRTTRIDDAELGKAFVPESASPILWFLKRATADAKAKDS